MAAKEQLTAMEMIWGFMSGTTGHMGKTDFAPQKEAFGDFASPETYFPRVTPESEGISSEKLTQMLRELAAARHTDMHHLLVLRNGQVICECNFAPYRSGIWHATYSMCKSITGMAVGFLISEGKLSLDENVYDIFEKRNGLLQKILRPNLTVEHLLTMKSGVQFNEMGVVSGNDWVDSFLNAPVKGTPGEAFEYNSMNTYLLSAIIQERTGMKMVDYLRPRLFEPLGIRKVFWESCPAGITKGGWGLFLCPEDAAKLGVMYVNGGKFEGKQIVPAEWVAASTSVHATPPEKMGKYGYGYQVWMEERPGSFAFNGMLGQNVLGYPDTGVVIVTNAGSNELFQTCEMLDIVRKYFGAEFGAELKSGEAESPMAYQKLVQTCRDLEGAKETPGRILRGGGNVQRLRLRDQVVKVFGAQRAGLLEDDLALLRDHQRGHCLDAGRAGQILVRVDVDLAEDDVGVLLTRGLERGTERAARAAPGGPEIHEHQVVVGDGLLEVLRIELNGCHDRFLPRCHGDVPIRCRPPASQHHSTNYADGRMRTPASRVFRDSHRIRESLSKSTRCRHASWAIIRPCQF